MKQLSNIILAFFYIGMAVLVNWQFGSGSVAWALYITLGVSLLISYNFMRIGKKSAVLLGVAFALVYLVNLGQIIQLDLKSLALFFGIIAMFMRTIFQSYLLVTKEAIVTTDRETSFFITGYTVLISLESICIYGYFMMSLFFETHSTAALVKVGMVGILYVVFQNIRKKPIEG